MASKLVALAMARSVFSISKPQSLCAFRTVRQFSGETNGGSETPKSPGVKDPLPKHDVSQVEIDPNSWKQIMAEWDKMSEELRIQRERGTKWSLGIFVPIVFVSTYATLSLIFPDMDPDQVEARRTSCESCKTK